MIHLSESFHWLKDNSACAWVVEQTRGGKFRRGTLLQELGQFPDKETALDAALRLCEHKPTVRAGVIYLRRLRLAYAGVEPKLTGDALDLTNLLIATINASMQRYPETTHRMLLSALINVQDVVAPPDDE